MTAVAVLGTGTIGEPIARNLARAGFDVTVWNRTREKAEPLAEDGATVCDAPAEAAQEAERRVGERGREGGLPVCAVSPESGCDQCGVHP